MSITFKKYLFKFAVWWLFGGYPPKEKEAFRQYLVKNLEKNVLPIIEWTETKVDDAFFNIVLKVIKNDSAWDVAWSLFETNEIISNDFIDVEPKRLQRLRERIGMRRMNRAASPSDICDNLTDKEAESVALVAMLVSIIANGPLAVINIRKIIQRIKNRGDNE